MSEVDLTDLSETEVRKILQIVKTDWKEAFEGSYSQYLKQIRLVNMLTIYCEGFEVDTEIKQEEYDRLKKILAKDGALVIEMPVNRPYGRHELDKRCFEYQKNVNADKMRAQDRAGADLAYTVLYAIAEYDESLPDEQENSESNNEDQNADNSDDDEDDYDEGDDEVKEKIIKKVKK